MVFNLKSGVRLNHSGVSVEYTISIIVVRYSMKRKYAINSHTISHTRRDGC